MVWPNNNEKGLCWCGHSVEEHKGNTEGDTESCASCFCPYFTEDKFNLENVK
jgi:hypothetical protein